MPVEGCFLRHVQVGDPRTTNLYDRRERRIKKNIVDKISV
jgi:hypothetical protein